MSPVDPSACPAPRSLRELIEAWELEADRLSRRWRECVDAGARALGDQYLFGSEKVHRCAKELDSLIASFSGDAAQDARPTEAAKFDSLLEDWQKRMDRRKGIQNDHAAGQYEAFRDCINDLKAVLAAQDAPPAPQGWDRRRTCAVCRQRFEPEPLPALPVSEDTP